MVYYECDTFRYNETVRYKGKVKEMYDVTRDGWVVEEGEEVETVEVGQD